MPAADSVPAALLRARRPLALDGAAAGPNGVNYRRWAAEQCAAEAGHATDDFWSCVHRLKLAGLFDRDDPSLAPWAGSVGGPEARFRFPHETHAFAALGWLSHLQAHESDKSGPWAAVRWQRWDADERRDWLRRRRVLWSGFVRQVERYREARQLTGASLCAFEIRTLAMDLAVRSVRSNAGRHPFSNSSITRLIAPTAE